MSSKTGSSQLCQKSGTKTDVEIRDLQSLLQKSLGNDLCLLDYRAENLLPKGENYASTILKVTATVKRTPDAPAENLELVGKMSPAAELKNDFFSITISFNKEIFVLEKLFPVYRKLQEDAGIEESELLNVAPETYGCRLSLNDESREADDNVAILMENLQVKGYKMMDRKKGLDFQHAQMALAELARYHALGIVCKQQNQEFFQSAKDSMEANPVTLTREVDYLTDQIRDILCADERISPYEHRIRKAFSEGWSNVMFTKERDNIWMTLTHGDFWVNNMLFRHDDNENPISVKFVDFQVSNHNAGQKDLPYFLLSSCNLEVASNKVDELLKIYYETFVDALNKMKCDSSLYTRDSFDERIKLEANDMFLRVVVAFVFMTLEVTEDFDYKDTDRIVELCRSNKNFIERAVVAVQNYVKRNWI